MNKILKATLLIVPLLMITVAYAAGEKPGSFSPHVDSKGNISLPTDFRSTWVHLGTWLVTSTAAAGQGIDQTGPGTGIHTVYTQPESLNAYKKNGQWPDGSMLVMEIRAMKWDDLPTGHVIVEGEPVKWLVMVKDAKGRFPKNQNWGDGWGWALFKPAALKNNASANYKNDCLSCHEPAKATDFVFIQGYPTLR
jgi:hypothetical protein